ncbi:MAG: hypothetical protein MJ117_01860 [Lachnospiraceae bacterium]|nr:hypothetical protein [Lachnospiraceae bacterium]
MAILLIKIEDTASLMLNEFFDYNGHAFALAGSRKQEKRQEFRMEEFYEASMDTEMLEDVPVFFVTGAEADTEASVIGWYKKARVSRKIRSVSLFLEGNVEAVISDAVLLPEKDRSIKIRWQTPDQLYEVVEEEDMRFGLLQRLLETEPAENALLRYAFAPVKLDPKLIRQPDTCLKYCSALARVLVEDQCRDISEIKLLEQYAKKVIEKKRSDPDGYYYHALACCHLGFFKDGIKSVQKALELEPEAADLAALKGMLLFEKGYYKDSAACFHKAYEVSSEEEYLLTEGRVCSAAGWMDKAYDCFAAVQNKELLDAAGIQLKEMEKRWSFANILSFRRKNRMKGKSRP